MADVFISYASEDRDKARALAKALAEKGWSIWWDRNIKTGQTFDYQIERELTAAKSVVVLWSAHSVTSEWVRSEASAAAERGVLLPANVDGAALPLEFRRKQTADLTGWNGSPKHEGFLMLCDAIGSIVDATALQTKSQLERIRHFRRLWPAIVLLMVMFSVGIVLVYRWQSDIVRIEQESSALPIGPSRSLQIDSPPLAGLADAIVGAYSGEVVSDSKGSSRSDVSISIEKIDANTVRIVSPYYRIGTLEVPVTRAGGQILNANGDTSLIVDLTKHPPTLTLSPHSELTFVGTFARGGSTKSAGLK